MNKKIIISYVALTTLILPAFVSAGIVIPPTPGDTLNVNSLINGIFSIVWTIFAGFAVLAYILAAFLFLTANGEAGKIKEARMAVIWGSAGIALGLLSVSIPLLIKALLGV